MNADETKKKWFLWGILLAWVPAVPLIYGMATALKGVSEQKATGLGAVAGGLGEVYLVFGIGLTLICEVAAIVLLVRAFSKGHLGRALISVLSILVSALILCLFGLFVWGATVVFTRQSSVIPQGLKPAFVAALNGTAEAVPLRNWSQIAQMRGPWASLRAGWVPHKPKTMNSEP